jgi:hypothetical protein
LRYYAPSSTATISAKRLGSVHSVQCGNHLSHIAQECHSERSGADFSSSFARANELRHAVEESLFDLSRKPRLITNTNGDTTWPNAL